MSWVKRHKRNGRWVKGHNRKRRHLYSNRADRTYEKSQFTRRYGRRKGRYVYGATVGKVRRERRANRGR